MTEALLAGWSRRFAAGGVVLVPPGGESGGALIRIHDREPRRPLASLVARLRSGAPPGADFALSDGPRALHTDEGEHAAFLECRIRLGDSEVQRSVGVVIGDQRFALIDGRVEDRARFPAFHDLVLTLTRGYTLGLGAARWRPFFYQPPPGWRGLARVRADLWLAPEFPRRRGSITVFHARPLAAAVGARQHRLLYEDLTLELRRVGETRPAAPSRFGLQGHMADFAGEGVRVTNLAYEDDRYLYLLRLETGASEDEAHRRAFATVAASVRPLPRPAVAAATAASPWVDDD